MKIKYFLLLIGLALALPATQGLAQVTGRTMGGSLSTGTGSYPVGFMAGTTGTNYGIEGTAHDFSQESWVSRNDVCGTCHVPHAPAGEAQPIPLWTHAMSTNSFTPFSSPQLQSLGITIPAPLPGSVTMACLSCHDGSVAVNQGFTSLSGTAAVNITSYNTAFQIGAGGDLSHVHPVSFSYDTAQAADPGGLNPSSGPLPSFIPNQTPGYWNPAATISKAMLTGGVAGGNMMECSSCHDVHAQIGNAAKGGLLLKISGVDTANRGSTLCRACHIK